MPRYVAFLRGVSPSNAKMADLKRAFEDAGFSDVTTVLSSGNVLFSARRAADTALARRAEAAMAARLTRPFPAIVRSVTALERLLDADPFAAYRLAANAKRVVTFLRDVPASPCRLPLEADGVRILEMHGREAFTAYVPNPRGPLFMTMIAKAFGANVTTRTWDTVGKCARA